MIDSPWATWLQVDLQCIFSPNRTEENKNYLIKILGEKWLKKRVVKVGATNHPIIQKWISDSGS